MSSLQKQIAARRYEAVQKHIMPKAELVAECLGTELQTYTGRGFEFAYEDDGKKLSILFLDEYGKTDESVLQTRTLIQFNSATVFDYQGDKELLSSGIWEEKGITSYIPGEAWEALLDKLHRQASEVKEEAECRLESQQAAAEKAEEDAERAKWGL